MGVLYARAFTQQALLDAWDQVRDAALADGRPDREVDVFENDAARRVMELSTALELGEWQPQPAFRIEIPKPSGGTRKLTIPTLADRVVERALLAVLDPVIDPRLLPWSFAYRRGLGAKDAVAALTDARDSGCTWVARADIRDCFDRIPQWEVMRRLRECIDDERVVHLVGLILDRKVRGERTAQSDRGRGLHQGSTLSPLLSNLYLDKFDRRMLDAGFRVIRYSDDFAIPVDSRVDGERALQTAGTELEDLRLELNSGKCRVVSFDDGVSFLGETVTASTLGTAERLSHPLETTVYVDRQGSLVRTRGDRLVVTDGDESLLRLSLRRVRQVVCYGRVGLTTAFLHRAVERGIEVVLLTEQGTLGGRLTAPSTSDPSARRAQYRAADDLSRARRLATGLRARQDRQHAGDAAAYRPPSGRRRGRRRCGSAGRLRRRARIGGRTGHRARAGGQLHQALLPGADQHRRPDLGFHLPPAPTPAGPDQRDALLRLHAAVPRGHRRPGGRRAGPDGRLSAPASLGSPCARAGPDGGVPPHHRRRGRLAMRERPPGPPRTIQCRRPRPGLPDGFGRQAHLPRRLRAPDAHPDHPSGHRAAGILPRRAVPASEGAGPHAARPVRALPGAAVEVTP